MGDHRLNPRAKLAAVPMPKMPKEVYGFQTRVGVELNKAKMAEVTELLDGITASGGDARAACPSFDSNENPEFFDYVVYGHAQVGRPSALLPDPRQIPTAMFPVMEMLRVPLVEIQKMANAAFDNAEQQAAPKH